MAETSGKEVTRFQRLAKDFVAGTVAGWAQVMIGQPFDTVKVRLQSQPSGAGALYQGPMDAAKKILQREGFRGFFKGSLAPLIGVGGCVSIQFAASSQARAFFHGNKPNSPLSIPEIAVCGGFAGLSNSILSVPVEHIRIRLQNNPNATQGPVPLVREMVQKYGIRTVYKGYTATLFREIPSYAAYFACYEYVLRGFVPEGGTINDVPGWKLLLAGAAGGYGCWLVSFPQDVIKSCIQADHLDPKKARYRGIVDCASQIYTEFGWRGFFRGFAPCMLRAFPANAGTFATYELVMRLFGGRDY